MRNIREHANQMRGKCVNLHKSENGIATRLQKSAVRVIIKTTGFIKNLSKVKLIFILLPCTVWKMVQEAKYPQESLQEITIEN